MAKLLVLKTEDSLCPVIQIWSQQDRHCVEIVSSPSHALSTLRMNGFDLVILSSDDTTNLEICRQYRSAGGSARMLVIGNNHPIAEESTYLDSGADDYLSKPWRINDLNARVRALLRRPATLSGEIYSYANLALDTGKKCLFRDGCEVHLMPKEYNLLEYLVSHPHHSSSPEQLLRSVWSLEGATPCTIRTYIKTLRKKIDTPGRASLVRSSRGLGYRISCPWVQKRFAQNQLLTAIPAQTSKSNASTAELDYLRGNEETIKLAFSKLIEHSVCFGPKIFLQACVERVDENKVKINVSVKRTDMDSQVCRPAYSNLSCAQIAAQKPNIALPASNQFVNYLVNHLDGNLMVRERGNSYSSYLITLPVHHHKSKTSAVREGLYLVGVQSKLSHAN